MKSQIQTNIDNLNLLLRDRNLQIEIEKSIAEISRALSQGLPLLVFGNGGSASDALHITGELVGKFKADRKSLNVICLNSNVSVITAWANILINVPSNVTPRIQELHLPIYHYICEKVENNLVGR